MAKALRPWEKVGDASSDGELYSFGLYSLERSSLKLGTRGSGSSDFTSLAIYGVLPGRLNWYRGLCSFCLYCDLVRNICWLCCVGEKAKYICSA